MSTSTSLLIDLAGVARLAGVRRPVASMWRRRFAMTSDPFPQAVAERAGRPVFDAARVAEWLARTEHGNNPDAHADVASAAMPADFSFDDQTAIDELEALIALHHHRGSLQGLRLAGLIHAATETDPHDEFLRSEVAVHARRATHWVEYAESLVDAAYSTSAALALVAERRSSGRSAAGSAGRLSSDAIALVVACVAALVADSGATVVLDATDENLSTAIANALGDECELALPTGPAARRVRRRLLSEDHWITGASAPSATRSVVAGRLPLHPDDSALAVLGAIDEISLTLRDADAAVIIGPARILVDSIASAEERVRADVLRSGRVRGIARLKPGLVDSAPREALALWVLGAPTGEIPIADRFTVVADLTDVDLTPATRADLVSDVVASMGSAREVRAHSFRFARFARTASLLARGGPLVGATASKRDARSRAAELPALLDAAATAVRVDLAAVAVTPAQSVAQPAATVAELIHDGHLRVIPGTRLDEGVPGSEGLVVVTSSDLDDPRAIGRTRVDQLAFAARHPTASLTRPGDVVFRTSPTAAAWVDADGSKVVAYPARVLRITAGHAGGLVPEVVAADVAGGANGPGAWKRWTLRKVAPHSIAPLRAALADIEAARFDLEARAARLTDYAALLVAGATSGAITVNESTVAADAASTN